MTATTIKTKDCKRCGKTFSYEPIIFFEKAMFTPPYCETCDEIEEAERRAEKLREQQEERRIKLMDMMPPIFRETSRERLPNPRLLDTVMRWEYGPVGLALRGPTGVGKSRVAWELVKREWMTGRESQAIDSSFGAKVSRLLWSGITHYDEWIRSLCKAPLLLMDDVTHCELTPRVEEALFRIIDTRTVQGRPFVITSNESGSSLADRIGSTKGQPLVRRIREFCETINPDGSVAT